jgi:hypothetical protein
VKSETQSADIVSLPRPSNLVDLPALAADVGHDRLIRGGDQRPAPELDLETDRPALAAMDCGLDRACKGMLFGLRGTE